MTAAVKVGDRVLYVADECYRRTVPAYPFFTWKARITAIDPDGKAELEIHPPGNWILRSGGVPYDAAKRPHSYHLDTDNGRD